MDFEKLPWRDGVSAVLACLLLKMLWDAVYRKIPRGFRSVRQMLRKQTESAENRHAEHMAEQESMKKEIHAGNKKKQRKATAVVVAPKKTKKRPRS